LNSSPSQRVRPSNQTTRGIVTAPDRGARGAAPVRRKRAAPRPYSPTPAVHPGRGGRVAVNSTAPTGSAIRS